VIIPQLLPAMISAFLIGFTLSIDDFIITIFNNNGVPTISTLIYGATRRPPRAEYRALGATIFFIVLAILIFVNLKILKNKKKDEKRN
jgi:spermidine/putrescine transport system permease protein